MTMTRAGWMRRKVIIETPTVTVDSPGGVVESWATYVTRWMEIRPLSGVEFWSSKQMYAEQVVTFVCRYDAALSDKLFRPDKRLALSNNDSPESYRYFDIVDIRNEHQRNRRVLILAKEKAR